MIQEINKNNIQYLENSFIPKSWIKNEFDTNPYAKLIVLQEKKEIIGYIYYSDIYERIEINQFEIKKIHRNCGKGKYLLREFLKNIEKPITLEVKIDNYPAIKIYEANGFVKKAIRKGYYNGVDALLMEKVK